MDTGKSSGFGIGELGSAPESTLQDDLDAMQLMAAATTTRDSTYHVTVWNPDGHETGRAFAGLSGALDYLRSLPVGWHGRIFADYTVGHLLSSGILEWREPLPLEQPRWECDECGGVQVKGGRCTQCGESDMLTYRTMGYVTHTEIRVGDVWVTPGEVVTAGKFVYDSWFWATGPVDEVRRNHRFDRYEFRIGNEWFNADDSTVSMGADE